MIWDAAVVTLIGLACAWAVWRRLRRLFDRRGGCCGCAEAGRCGGRENPHG
jgi:hypothetical protein